MVQNHLACKKDLDIRLSHGDSRSTQISPGNLQGQLPYFDGVRANASRRHAGQARCGSFRRRDPRAIRASANATQRLSRPENTATRRGRRADHRSRVLPSLFSPGSRLIRPKLFADKRPRWNSAGTANIVANACPSHPLRQCVYMMLSSAIRRLKSPRHCSHFLLRGAGTRYPFDFD